MRIGVFDSGIGGISVLNTLRARFPQHEYTYFGDTAHVPYGSKSVGQIQTYCQAAGERMKSEQVDLLVVACNTASSLALPQIREKMGQTPVVDVVGPGVASVVQAIADKERSKQGKTVLVLATRATVRSQAYPSALQAALPQEFRVVQRECPLLVPLIEEGWFDHAATRVVLQDYLGEHMADQDGGCVLLGCTHYPWILPLVRELLPRWQIVHSATAVADSLAPILGEGQSSQGLMATKVKWIFSDPVTVPALAVLKDKIPSV
jgi:glutamate racemase